jgi:hypothetical protein
MKLARKAGHLKGGYLLKSKNPFRDFGRDFIDSRFKIYGLKFSSFGLGVNFEFYCKVCHFSSNLFFASCRVMVLPWSAS